jgi:hypothetical protein
LQIKLFFDSSNFGHSCKWLKAMIFFIWVFS